MNKERSLEEDMKHGTREQPVWIARFDQWINKENHANFHVQRHWHGAVELLLIEKGSFTAEINLEDHLLQPGDICMINSGELHQIDGNEYDTLHSGIIFDPAILQFCYEDRFQEQIAGPFGKHKLWFPHKISKASPSYEEVRNLLQEIFQMVLGKEETNWYLPVKLKLLQLLYMMNENHLLLTGQTSISGREKEKIDRYKRVVSYIEDHYMESVRLEDLARVAQCNPQYLCHYFKEISGHSPVQYLINYRVGQAKRLLENTAKTVLDISLDCGFENVSYFIRQFKQVEGITPRQYRVSQEMDKS